MGVFFALVRLPAVLPHHLRSTGESKRSDRKRKFDFEAAMDSLGKRMGTNRERRLCYWYIGIRKGQGHGKRGNLSEIANHVVHGLLVHNDHIHRVTKG